MQLNFTLKEKKSYQGILIDKYRPLLNYQKSSDSNIVEMSVTDKLHLNLNNPVDINCQKSYDDSVNLIINDGYNTPKLINTRFAVRGSKSYELIDRYGNADTNIYREDTFQKDISLFRTFSTFSNVELIDIIQGGSLKVGNYIFYFKYSDSDGNETNIFAQSGLCPVYLGSSTNKNGAYADYNSNKIIRLQLNNLDTQYSDINIYYSRFSSDQFQLTSSSCYKILTPIHITNSTMQIIINGNEPIQEYSKNLLNTRNITLNYAKTATQLNNTLFLANVQKYSVEYENLKDLSLRIHAKVRVNQDVVVTDTDKNVYNYVGYFPNEFYRFGIVYVYDNNQESPVFNIRGSAAYVKEQEYVDTPIFDNGRRQYVSVDETNQIIKENSNSYCNSAGVVYTGDSYMQNTLGISFEFNYKEDIINELKRQNIIGYYFVRQKRIPRVIAQAYIGHMSNCEVPTTLTGKIPSFHGIWETEHDTKQKLIQSKILNSKVFFGICPDFTVRQPYFNQIFNTDEFTIEYSSITKDKIKTLDNVENVDCNGVLYPKYAKNFKAKIISVPEDVQNIKLEGYNFCSRAGNAEELKDFKHGVKTKKDLITNWDTIKTEGPIVRGVFSPYLAIVATSNKHPSETETPCICNIISPSFTGNTLEEVKIRYSDKSPYSSISDILYLENINTTEKNVCYRGDCYNCYFTQRLFRNFQDPTSPNNDTLVKNTGYELSTIKDGNMLSFQNINRGDINAIKTGVWTKLYVKSVNNLNIRSIDDTHASEIALTGKNRAYYPINHDLSGNNKIPESYFINEGFSQSLGLLHKFTKSPVPYNKNNYSNRIYYSNLTIKDSFQNGYRIFKENQYKDYNLEFGAITKIVEFKGLLVVIFQHGIGYAKLNPRTISNSNFINTNNILPEELTIISDEIGSLYKDSIISSDNYIYGIDTVQKKIWRYGTQLEIISQSKIESFLQKAINTLEVESSIHLGFKNCKSFYNSQKRDVMFTFYNKKEGFTDEVAFNVCYNEIIDQWVTFYSWIPLLGENLNGSFISFNRDLCRDNLLGLNLSEVFSNTKQILDTMDQPVVFNFKDTFENYSVEVVNYSSNPEYVNIQTTNTGVSITWDKEKLGQYLNKYKYYDVVLSIKSKSKNYLQNIRIIGLHSSLASIENSQFYFYSHGANNQFDYQEQLKPTYWYDKIHPFEFEYIVNEKLNTHKIFDNITIIGNKSLPQSYHYTITGDCFEFAEQKDRMYFRQEASKALYKNLGSAITYDEKVLTKDFADTIKSSLRSVIQLPEKTIFKKKSTILPCIYNMREDVQNSIEDTYIQLSYYSKNYMNLSGGEIVKMKDGFYIQNHCLAVPMEKEGRLRGNMYYQDDRLFVQINPIIITQKNENIKYWADYSSTRPGNFAYPSIVLKNVPYDIEDSSITANSIPKELKKLNYNLSNIDYDDWGIFSTNSSASTREEIKVKDKYIKIKFRYSGNDKTYIYSILTSYNYEQ